MWSLWWTNIIYTSGKQEKDTSHSSLSRSLEWHKIWHTCSRERSPTSSFDVVVCLPGVLVTVAHPVVGRVGNHADGPGVCFFVFLVCSSHSLTVGRLRCHIFSHSAMNLSVNLEMFTYVGGSVFYMFYFLIPLWNLPVSLDCQAQLALLNFYLCMLRIKLEE